MSYIWLSFCSGTSYCLEFSTTSNSHAACESLPHLVALCNPCVIHVIALQYRSICLSIRDSKMSAICSLTWYSCTLFSGSLLLCHVVVHVSKFSAQDKFLFICSKQHGIKKITTSTTT